MNCFRVVFSPNGLEPFISNQPDYISAIATARLIADFDLGRVAANGNPTLLAYQAYRRKYGINHPDLINISICSVEQFENGQWWVISETLEDTPDYTVEDEIEGYSE